MNSDDAFAIWAPLECPWSPWVKPILFANEPDWSGGLEEDLPDVGDASWIDDAGSTGGYRDATKPIADGATAYVVDLSAAAGVAWGVALAQKGVRPIPLYNALPGGYASPFAATPPVGEPGAMGEPFAPRPIDTSAFIDMTVIVRAMRRATSTLSDLALPTTAPPTFLLDADRRYGVGLASPGRFDNRSISLPTDFPSAVFLRSRGITRVVLVQQDRLEPQEDLAHTLLAWQEGGLVIEAKSLATDAPPSTIQVTKPSRFRSILYRFLATMGLRRSPLGGFGGTIPLPSAG